MAFTAIVIGITGLSLVPLADYFFPKPYQADTIVRVAAGLSQPKEGGKASTGGGMPNIALFDGNGGRIGFLSGQRHGKIEDGRYADITVHPIDRNNNRPAEYISLSASSTDALCIAYIAVTHPSKEYWAFSGDNAVTCGASWYHSNLAIQTSNRAYKPKCFWIDSFDDDGKTTNNFPQGVGIHLIDFVGNEARYLQYKEKPDTMCKSEPRFKLYPKLGELNCLPVFNPPIEYSDDGADKDLKAALSKGEVMCTPHPGDKPSVRELLTLRRYSSGRFPMPTYGVKKRSGNETELELHEEIQKEVQKREVPNGGVQKRTCFQGDIVISDSMSAKELCADPNSHGPDFVSKTEGMFCDLCAHKLWPVCRETAAVKKPVGCFDMTTKKMRYDGEKAARDGTKMPEKTYTNVRHWK